MKQGIMMYRDYGKINICLKELIDSKGITRNKLATLADTRFEVIDKWYKNKVEKIDADILARICYVLDCEVEDVIKYRNE